MRKRIIAIFMALVVALPFAVDFDSDKVVTVSAETVQEKIDKASQEKRDALEKIEEAQEEKDDVVAESNQLEREIDIIQTEIYAIEDLIAEADSQIAEKEEEIKGIEGEIENQDEQFKECLRAMEENSAVSYIELLLSSSSFSELLINIESINEITEYDMAIIDEMTQRKTEAEEIKAEIELYRSEQEEARSLAEGKRGELEDKLAEKEALTAALEADIEKYTKVYEDARKQEEDLKASVSSSLSTSETSTYTGSGQFCWPAPSYTRISSPYGYRIHPIYKTKKFHSGVDMAAPGGTNILAAESGTVKFAGWNGGYGNCLIIDHGGGITTLYGHASRLCVSKGQTVTRGQVVAKVGTTGNSTGNHLHFEVLINGKTTDPMAYLK